MPEPMEALAAEAAGGPVAAPEASDVVEGAEPAARPPSTWERLKRLFQRTERTPHELAGAPAPYGINRLIDRRGPRHAEEAMVGESVMICIEAVLSAEGAADATPAAFLLQSMNEYARLERQEPDEG